MHQRNKQFSVSKVVSTLFVVLVFSVPAGAAEIFTASYVATPGEGTAQGGFNNYFDDTGSQLIDSVYGGNDWNADLGNGHSYEWVGWRVANPVITFTFSSPVTISQVGIDFNRNEPDGNLIFLPPTVTIGGTDFSVAPDAIPNATRQTVYFDGSWTGTTLTVTLTDNDTSHWIFVDEVTFVCTTVPESSALALLIGGFGLAAVCRRRIVISQPACPPV